jgi:hypothetical protein
MRAPKIYRFLSIALAVATTLVVQSAYAVRIQGFESGDPAVNGFGDAGTQTSYQGEAATDPTHWYLLTTFRSTDNEDGITSQSGNNALAFATFNDASHFNGAAPVGVDGSGVFIPFTVNSGDQFLTFNYDFLSNEPGQSVPRNDFSFAGFFTTSGTLIAGTRVTFATVTGSTFGLFDGQSPFVFHTGVQMLSMSVAGLAPGSYLLGIGVEDATNGDHASGILIDNVDMAAAPVPEPTTVGFTLAGAALLVALRSRIRKTS